MRGTKYTIVTLATIGVFIVLLAPIIRSMTSLAAAITIAPAGRRWVERKINAGLGSVWPAHSYADGASRCG